MLFRIATRYQKCNCYKNVPPVLNIHLLSFGSIVQKGKFSAGAELLVITLKKVDFPTFGTPTIPQRKFVPTLPIKGLTSGSPTFFGAISIEESSKT